jgi:hypothetical protein
MYFAPDWRASTSPVRGKLVSVSGPEIRARLQSNVLELKSRKSLR